MFKQLLIDGIPISNYKINKSGAVINKRNETLKPKGKGYCLYVNGKHKMFATKDLIKWSFNSSNQFVDTSDVSYLVFEKKINDMGIGVRNSEELISNFVTIVNPALYDIDPNSNYLSKTTEKLIIEECKINPWYFYRRIAKLEMDDLVYLAVKSSFSDVMTFIQTETTYDTIDLLNAIVTYNILFGERDICVYTDKTLKSIDHYVKLDEDHWLRSIGDNKLLFTLKPGFYPTKDLKDVLYINAEPEVSRVVFNQLVGYIRPTNNIGFLSITQKRSNEEPASYYASFDKANIYGSANLLRSEANKCADFPVAYVIFNESDLGINARETHIVGEEGLNPFFDYKFQYKSQEPFNKMMLKSFNETIKNYINDKFRKDGKNFFPFARRVLDNELNLPSIDKMTEDTIIGLFTVKVNDFKQSLLESSKKFEPEDLIYILFGSRNYREINKQIANYDSYERHIMCTLYHQNMIWEPIRNSPAPVTLSVESLLKLFYR